METRNSLLLTPELFLSEGGIARIMRLYLKALCEIENDGDRVRLLSLNDGLIDSTDLRRYSTKRLVEWHVCARSKALFIRKSLQMGRVSSRIVCGHVAQLPVAWAASLIRPGLSYYLVAHGIEVWEPFSVPEKIALRGARRIFCVSDFTRRRLLELCPLPEGRAVVVYNALDPNLQPESTVPPAEAPPVILSISRLSAADGYKGVNHLIEAMPAVAAAIPGSKLRIVGRGDGLNRLQARAAALNLGKSVEFAGYRSDAELRADFDGSRMFALPSEKEGFGLVYVEAMAHGRPCLGTRSGGIPEVISPETGELVEYGDVPAISAALVRGLTRDWDEQAILARAREFSYLRFRDRVASVLSE
jgi:phosphatidylinositol alpha-1,6-mannosyltransferase